MQAQQLHNSAVLAYRQGNLGLAEQEFAQALALEFAPSGKALFSLLIQRAAYPQAFEVAHRLLQLLPMDFGFSQHLLEELADYARRTQPKYESLAEAAVRPISFAICSHRDERFAQVQAVLVRAMARHPYELIRIADARCINEGYARAVSQCQYELVVLCHDDIDVLIPDFAERLCAAMTQFDVLGVAGTKQLSGDTLWHDGHPLLAGQIWHPPKPTLPPATPEFARAATLNFGPALSSAQALDGVLIAARKAQLIKLGFDASQPGFHYYDLDLSYRAFQSGARVGICQNLGVMHHSAGQLSPEWHQARAWFGAKHPLLSQVPAPNSTRHWYECAVMSREQALYLQQALNQFRAMAP